MENKGLENRGLKNEGLENGCLENKGFAVGKALLHMALVFAVYVLTDSFCHEIIRMAIPICSSTIFITALYTCLDILNVWTAVFLYAKYILKMPFSKIYLGKPFPALRWCAAAIAMPLASDAIYFIFTKGEFKAGYHTQEDLVYILFHDIFSFGLRIAVTEGLLFRGLLLGALQKELGKKWGILISSFFYAAASFLFFHSFVFAAAADDWGMFLLAFLMGLAFVFVTCESGSVWSSVVIHFLYNVLSGSAYILHIDTKQYYPAVFTYTFESGSIFFTSLPLPSIAVFSALIVMALVFKNCL